MTLKELLTSTNGQQSCEVYYISLYGSSDDKTYKGKPNQILKSLESGEDDFLLSSRVSKTGYSYSYGKRFLIAII